jgi:hypothetical protein
MTLPASIPLRRDSPDNTGWGDRGDPSGIAALGLVLIVAIFAVAWWRKRGRPGKTEVAGAGRRASLWHRLMPGALRVDIAALSSTHLTAHHSVHEVHWQGKRLLIGCADGSICLLAEVPVEAQDHATGSPDPRPNVSQAGD